MSDAEIASIYFFIIYLTYRFITKETLLAVSRARAPYSPKVSIASSPAFPAI